MAYKKNKELIDEYMTEIGKLSTYRESKPFNVIRLSDGSLLGEDNDNITTSFCFGWSNLWPEMGSWQDARKKKKECETDPSYFLNTNIEAASHRLMLFRDNPIQLIHYWGNKDTILRVAYPVKDGRVADGAELVTNEADIFQIRNLVYEQYENFKKRLTTYLKKYGLSKLKTWTFCYDD